MVFIYSFVTHNVQYLYVHLVSLISIHIDTAHYELHLSALSTQS